jgi:hypothetical protein
MGAILEGVLALIGFGLLIVGAARPYLGGYEPDQVIDREAAVLEAIAERHQVADAALRRSAARRPSATDWIGG